VTYQDGTNYPEATKEVLRAQ